MSLLGIPGGIEGYWTASGLGDVASAQSAVLDAVFAQVRQALIASDFDGAIRFLNSEDTLNAALDSGRGEELSQAIKSVAQAQEAAAQQSLQNTANKGKLDKNGQIVAMVGSSMVAVGSAIALIPGPGTIIGGIIGGAGAITTAVSPYTTGWSMKVGALFGGGGSKHQKRARAFYAQQNALNVQKAAELAEATKMSQVAVDEAKKEAVAAKLEAALLEEIAANAPEDPAAPSTAFKLRMGALGLGGLVLVGAIVNRGRS